MLYEVGLLCLRIQETFELKALGIKLEKLIENSKSVMDVYVFIFMS